MIDMGEPCLKKIVRLSWIREYATEEFTAMRQNQLLDPSFFTEEEMEHYIKVLIMSHADDWMVINDIENEGII